MSNEPLYIQVKNDILQKIFDGVYKDGEPIASERALSLEYALSRETIRKALELLENDGIIQRKLGKGTIVQLNRHSYSGSLDIIALVAPAQRQFFGVFIEHFQKVADRHNTLVVFVQQSESERIEHTLFKLLKRNIHNVVLWLDYEKIHAQSLRLLRGLGMNIVLFDIIEKTPYADCVCLDNRHAIHTLYNYVTAKGSKGIAYITRENSTASSHRERLHAFQALSPTEIVWKAPWNWNSMWDYINYFDFMHNPFIFDHLATSARPDSVICSDGSLGLAIKKAMQQQGISDVRLVSVDDYPEFRELGITAYKQPFHRFATRIFDCLLEQSSNAAKWKASVYRIEGELCIQDS